MFTGLQFFFLIKVFNIFVMDIGFSCICLLIFLVHIIVQDIEARDYY